MQPTKGTEFFIGFAITVALGVLALVVGVLFQSVVVSLVLAPLLSLATIVAALVQRRPFIALGVVTALAVPFLAFGACLLMFGGPR